MLPACFDSALLNKSFVTKFRQSVISPIRKMFRRPLANEVGFENSRCSIPERESVFARIGPADQHATLVV